MRCPNCGCLLKITAEKVIEESKEEKERTKKIRSLLDQPQSTKKKLDVEIEGRWLKITYTGKFNQKRFQSLNMEITELGGQYIKGHWRVPLSNLNE